MYKEKMVVSLKNKEGKIIREQGDIILLPFGSEYSIYFKNLESRKVKVKISIDGKDILDGKSLLINANDTTELEGFLKDNIVKNAFRFIEKTQEISEFRGDNLDDGIIRVEFTYEKMKPVTQTINTIYQYPLYSKGYFYHSPLMPTSINYMSNTDCKLDSVSNCNTTISNYLSKSFDARDLDCSAKSISLDNLNDAGITVKGSEINQEFKYGKIEELEEQSYVLIIRLKGYKENNDKVEKIITVKDKLQCLTCGKVSKSDAKFCDRCGTYLE